MSADARETITRADSDDQAPGERLDLADLASLVLARSRLLIPAFAIAMAGFLGYVLLTPTRYTASMSIMIDPRERAPAGVDAQPIPQSPDPALVESQMRALTSKAVFGRLVDAEHLTDDSDFAPTLLDSTLEVLGALTRDRSGGAADKREAVVDALGKLIAVKRAERSYVLDVDVSAGTREKAVARANALAEAYFANQQALADDLAKKQGAFLGQRVDDLRKKAEAAERRAQDARDSNSIATVPGGTAPGQQLGAANAALIAANGKRAEVAARLRQVQAAEAAGAAGTTLGALNSPVIEKLRQDYSALARDEANQKTVLGPRHPQYLATLAQMTATQEQIRAELSRIAEATRRELRAAESTERDAERLVAKSERATQTLGDKSVDLAALDAEAASLRAAYEKAVAASENVRRDALQSPLGTLVDPPVAAQARTSPRKTPAMLIALAAAFNSWVLMALVSALWERRAARVNSKRSVAAGPAPPGARPSPWAPSLGALERALAGRVPREGRDSAAFVVAPLEDQDASALALRLADRLAAVGKRVLVTGEGEALKSYAATLLRAGAPSRLGISRAPGGRRGDVFIARSVRSVDGTPMGRGAIDLHLDCARSLADARARIVRGRAGGLIAAAGRDADPGKAASELANAGLSGECVAIVPDLARARSPRAA